MTRYLIRIDGTASADLLSAFPHLTAEEQQIQTVLTGQYVDQAQLSGVLNHLDQMGIRIVEVMSLP